VEADLYVGCFALLEVHARKEELYASQAEYRKTQKHLNLCNRAAISPHSTDNEFRLNTGRHKSSKIYAVKLQSVHITQTPSSNKTYTNQPIIHSNRAVPSI